jgi:hypothetical protein
LAHSLGTIIGVIPAQAELRLRFEPPKGDPQGAPREESIEPTTVIPAKAGIQSIRGTWIPDLRAAPPGMTLFQGFRIYALLHPK